MSEARELARRRKDFKKTCNVACTLWNKSGNGYAQYAPNQWCFVATPQASSSPYLNAATREALTLPQGRVIYMPWDSANVQGEHQIRTADGKYRAVTVYRDYSSQEGLAIAAEKIG